MKSILMLMPVLALISCGRVEVPDGDSIGQFQEIRPETKTGTELATITKICDSIKQKNPQGLVNSNYFFNYSRKDCSDTSFPTPTEVSVTLSNTSQGYKFTTAQGINFVFSDIETADAGSMKVICDRLSGSLVSPIAVGTDYTFFKATGILSADCTPNNADEVCILIEKASPSGETKAKVYQKEWIRFDLGTARGKRGFFTKKKIITQYGCTENATSGQMAELK